MEASDGDEAIALWRQEKPDLIFMDLRMQGMSGLDATARIREQQRALAEKPATRIVVLSASAFDHERTEAIERGADAFLAKPFREDAVFSQLENLLGTRFAREAGVDPQSATVRSGLSPESVAALPLELRQRLAAAAAGGESNLLQTLAEEAAAFDPRAAAELATLARAYRFDEIEAALAAITPAGLSS
jgi:CheY-like chemotaxis protein